MGLVEGRGGPEHVGRWEWSLRGAGEGSKCFSIEIGVNALLSTKAPLSYVRAATCATCIRLL